MESTKKRTLYRQTKTNVQKPFSTHILMIAEHRRTESADFFSIRKGKYLRLLLQKLFASMLCHSRSRKRTQTGSVLFQRCRLNN